MKGGNQFLFREMERWEVGGKKKIEEGARSTYFKEFVVGGCRF